MNRKVLNINEVVLKDYSQSNFKVLHMYAVTSYVFEGYGYCSIKGYIEKVSQFAKVSTKTARRWITKLHEERLINIRKGIIYIKGRKKIEVNHDTTQTYVKFSEKDLKSYKAFQYHTIRQIALLTQRRFSYAINILNIEDSASLVKTGKVDSAFAVVKDSKKTGCSISQLEKKLGFDKMTISNALVGYAKKQSNKSHPIKGKVVRKRFKDMIDNIAGDSELKVPGPGGKPVRVIKRAGDSYKWSFEYNSSNDTYILVYATASRITVDSSLCRKK